MYKWQTDTEIRLSIDGVDDAECEMVQIRDGQLTIKAGYAWNGCSPKLNVFDLFYIGCPDGIVDYRTGKQKCYYPTLVHDALYQYGIVTRAQADKIFLELMKKAEFKPAYIYYWAVRIFGKLWRKK